MQSFTLLPRGASHSLSLTLLLSLSVAPACGAVDAPEPDGLPSDGASEDAGAAPEPELVGRTEALQRRPTPRYYCSKPGVVCSSKYGTVYDSAPGCSTLCSSPSTASCTAGYCSNNIAWPPQCICI